MTDKTVPVARISKLPKWAQERIRQLEMRREELSDLLAKVTGQWPESRITICGAHLDRMHLPDFETIEFATNQSDTVVVGYNQDDDCLEVRGFGKKLGMLSVQPISGNSITVRIAND